jgi:CheY-like chemotaxis protein
VTGGGGKEPGFGEAERSALWAHDLRAALSDVIGGLRLIDEAALDAAPRTQIARVRVAAESLARLLDSALRDLPEGVAAPRPEAATIHLGRFLADLSRRWTGRAAEKDIAFAIEIAPGLPRLIRADRTALDRALANLLANAVKYTDAGAVRMRVDIGEAERLTFTVADSGPGLSPQALDRLYQYAARPEGAGKPGTGLGLHIAREMAGEMGADLTLANRADGGAEARLCLPPAAWTAPALDSLDDAPGLVDLSHLRVLVAEDGETNRLLAERMLGAMGAEAVTAADGAEALHLLERESFDLALLDIEMPRLSGLEVLRAVRAARNGLERLPMVALTAYVLRAQREEIYAAGADGIVAKPITSAEHFGAALRDFHERALHQRGDGGAPAAAVAAAGGGGAGGAGAGPDGIDRQTFESLLGIAGPEAADELLEKLRADIAGVRQGLERAAETGDLAEIRAQTHVLVAVAGAVGATDLQAAAQTLNAAAHLDSVELDALSDRTLAGIAALAAFLEDEVRRRGAAR